MIDIKNKYVYKTEKMDNFYGMMPLDIYIILTYCNYEEKKDVLIGLNSLSHFITECLVELFTREKIDFSKVKILAEDFYISATPSIDDHEMRKILVYKHADIMFVISEFKYFNSDGLSLDYLEMKDISKEELMQVMFSAQQIVLILIVDVIKKIDKYKKISLAGADEIKEEEEKKESPNNQSSNPEDKFNLQNYEKI